MSEWVEKVARSVLERYSRRTKRSKLHYIEAQKFLPGGDTRSVTFFLPHPLYMEKGKGCCLCDCDGNEYVDFLNNYTSLIHGHAHPHIMEVIHSQLDKGTVFPSPVELQYKHAEHLCCRIPSLEMIRYCNSGTEATLFAIRAARAFRGKDMILKMDGGYHGSHDFMEVNVKSDPWTTDPLIPHLEGKGIPASVLGGVLVAPFNDLDAVEALLKVHSDRTAAIIVEPMLGGAGLLPPESGYLRGLRELADRYKVLLIFDEVITFRLGLGGMQEITGVGPDLTALGKIIGGGLPVGAFGGKREFMMQFDPHRSDALIHSGTYNGNSISMAAGLAAMELYDQNAINRVNELGERLRMGFDSAFERVGIKGQTTGLGSLAAVHWGEGEVRNARDASALVGSAAQLPKLLHLEMMNRGIFSAPRGMYVISTPMTEREIDKAVEAFEGALSFLRPYAAEAAPHLLMD